MRVLIFTTLLAVAAAAPSGLYAPIIPVVPVIKTVAVPKAIPTISPGDIQAAAIDAQVKLQDQLQAAIDKARELAEQATENVNEKLITDSTVVNEQNLEAFWSAEDKKWQAVDALKTAEAKVDGAVANNANIFAKSAVGGVIPYVPAVGPIAPIVAPVPPIVYSPYILPTSYSKQLLITGQEIKTEIKEENKEGAGKAAEPVQVAEPAEAEKTEKAESVETEKAEAEMTLKAEPQETEKAEAEMTLKAETQETEKAEAEQTEKAEVAASPAVKAAENLKEKPALITQPLFLGTAQLGLPNLYRYDVGVPAVRHVIGQPILNYATAVQHVPHGVLTPTFVKAW